MRVTIVTDDLTTPTTEQFAVFGEYVAALLGTDDWADVIGLLEEIDQASTRILGQSVGSTHADVVSMWRLVADRADVEYADDDDDDDVS